MRTAIIAGKRRKKSLLIAAVTCAIFTAKSACGSSTVSYAFYRIAREYPYHNQNELRLLAGKLHERYEMKSYCTRTSVQLSLRVHHIFKANYAVAFSSMGSKYLAGITISTSVPGFALVSRKVPPNSLVRCLIPARPTPKL